MAQDTELDLDAIEGWFEGKTEHSSLDDLGVVAEWHAVRDLIAEVRRLRAERAMPADDRDQLAVAIQDGVRDVFRAEPWLSRRGQSAPESIIRDIAARAASIARAYEAGELESFDGEVSR